MFKARKRKDPPLADALEFSSNGAKVLYEYVVELYRAVGRLEGSQKLRDGLLLAMFAGMISLVVKLWMG